MNRPKVTVITLLIIIVVLWFIQSYITINVYFEGWKLVQFQDEINHYKVQNAILREQVLRRSALTTVAEEAKKQGFHKGVFLYTY